MTDESIMPWGKQPTKTEDMSTITTIDADTAAKIAKENEHKEIQKVFNRIDTEAREGELHTIIPGKLHRATIEALERANYEVLNYNSMGTLIRWLPGTAKAKKPTTDHATTGYMLAILGWGVALVLAIIVFLLKKHIIS